MIADKLLQEALNLPSRAREDLIDALSQSLEPTDVTDAWKTEIAERLEKLQRGGSDRS